MDIALVKILSIAGLHVVSINHRRGYVMVTTKVVFAHGGGGGGLGYLVYRRKQKKD
jgi:hypothetical protein